MAPETLAVLAACRTFLGDCPRETGLDALTATDPGPLLAVLRRERLGPLAHHVLGGAPSALTGAVAADYYAAARRYVRFAERLGELLAAFRAAGVAAAVLKGMALAEALYENPALRPMDDVDVLVRQDDVGRARAALEALGYAAPASFAHEVRHRAASMFTRAEHGAPPARVDVHWALVDAKSSPVAGRWADGVWERAGQAALGGERMPVLDPTDALLHACVHLTVNHGLAGLLWRLDVALMGRRWAGRLDWDRAVAACTAGRLTGVVSAALHCVEATLGPTVPGKTLDRLRPRAVRGRGLERWLLPRFAALRSIPYQDYVVPLLAIDRARDVAALLFRRLRA